MNLAFLALCVIQDEPLIVTLGSVRPLTCVERPRRDDNSLTATFKSLFHAASHLLAVDGQQRLAHVVLAHILDVLRDADLSLAEASRRIHRSGEDERTLFCEC